MSSSLQEQVLATVPGYHDRDVTKNIQLTDYVERQAVLPAMSARLSGVSGDDDSAIPCHRHELGREPSSLVLDDTALSACSALELLGSQIGKRDSHRLFTETSHRPDPHGDAVRIRSLLDDILHQRTHALRQSFQRRRARRVVLLDLLAAVERRHPDLGAGGPLEREPREIRVALVHQPLRGFAQRLPASGQPSRLDWEGIVEVRFAPAVELLGHKHLGEIQGQALLDRTQPMEELAVEACDEESTFPGDLRERLAQLDEPEGQLSLELLRRREIAGENERDLRRGFADLREYGRSVVLRIP